MRLAPSILSFDLPSLASSIRKLADLNPDVIHLDVMDGRFVPPISFGDSYVKALRPLVETPFEAHLMVKEPEKQFGPFVEAGCSRVIFHAEATLHAHRLIQELKQLGVQAGIAINPATPVEVLLPVLEEIDMALVMTVNPGWGGQSFLPLTLPKIRRIRAERPDLTIEVDGGIDPDTIGTTASAGADLFVVGSYLAKSSDLSAAVARLRAACP